MEVKFQHGQIEALKNLFEVVKEGQLFEIKLSEPSNPLFQWASRHTEVEALPLPPIAQEMARVSFLAPY